MEPIKGVVVGWRKKKGVVVLDGVSEDARLLVSGQSFCVTEIYGS